MLSKNKIKHIRSLELKKFRDEYGVFVAEGNKLVEDMLGVFECQCLIANSNWITSHTEVQAEEIIADDEGELSKVSFLKTPKDVVAIFRKKTYTIADVHPDSNLTLCLDGIQNPGNMGTIVRLASWFGIRDVVCSLDTADIYSPKAMQATMGAMADVRVHYTELESWLAVQRSADVPIYGTFLNGENIYTTELTAYGVLVMGNEGNGIRPEVENHLSRRLHIPSYSHGTASAESLNVAIAAALSCSEFRRRQY
jgi:TrmH family RNA methyltransferase